MMAPEHSRLRQVVLVADSNQVIERALRAAISLAVASRASLSGVFVENEDILRAAQLPTAREVGIASAQIRALDISETQRALHSQAERLRCALAEVSEQRGLAWSFRVDRGRAYQHALDSLSQAVAAVLAPMPRAGQLAALPLRAAMTGKVLCIVTTEPDDVRVIELAEHLAAPGEPIHLASPGAPLTENAIAALAERSRRVGGRPPQIVPSLLALPQQLPLSIGMARYDAVLMRVGTLSVARLVQLRASLTCPIVLTS